VSGQAGMLGDEGTIRLGDALPAIRLTGGHGETVDLAAWRGRPLVLVCVRYYG
jgi:peroxiredoxin